MNSEEILKKTARLEALLGTPCDRMTAEELLPHYTLLKQLSKYQSFVRERKANDILLKIEKLKGNVSKLTGVLESSTQIAKSLQYLVDSSRVLVHIVNYSMRSGSIPMPRDHHEKFLQIIENSTLVVADKKTWKRSPIAWQEVSSVLKSTADTFRSIAEVLDYNIGEHQLLYDKTTKLLEQMSELHLNESQ